MPVALLPPLTRSGPFVGAVRSEALAEGPAYVRTRAMSRWHRVRSAVSHTIGGEPAHTSYHAWCGQSLYSSSARGVDAPDDGAPVCGTCEGRALGHSPQRPDLLFTPDVLTQPRFCPNRTLFHDAGANVGRCLACTQLAPVRCHGWNGVPKLTQHTPVDLVPGCPFHAWRYLAESGDTAVCRCRLEPMWGAA